MTKATAGRPTEYDQKYNSLVEGMFRGGATDNEVIKALGVARSTFYLWKQEHEDFAEVVRRGKEHFDSGRMEESLKSKAAGFYVLEEVVTEEDAGGKVLKKVTRRKQMPPDTAALKYWLGNRQPDRWRDQPEEAPTEREPLEIHVTVSKPAPEEVPEEYLIADEGQEG
jgi:hypothetical protein